jgi:hypothetical protein
MTKCKNCNSNCKQSKALLNTLVESTDLGTYGTSGNTQSRVGDAELVDCMKCENCGHSFIPTMTNEEKLSKLFQIAEKNGWEEPFAFNISLNDLVTDYEVGKVSFIEALVRTDHLSIINWSKTMDIGWVDIAIRGEFLDSIMPSLIEALTSEVIQSWSYDYNIRKIRPNSERLTFLLETFKHLL